LLGDLLIEINAMTAAPSPPMQGWELAYALAERTAKSRARLTIPWSVAARPTESRSLHPAKWPRYSLPRKDGSKVLIRPVGTRVLWW